MENKEIYIDGVNIAGCEKFGETVAGITCGLGKRIRFANEIITKHNLCEDNPNCYYKQLKRLEQENKELKECTNTAIIEQEKLLSQLNAEREENKDLKKQIESDKGLITVGGKQQYQYLQKIDELEQENKELKKKLELDEVQLNSYFIGEEKICKENEKCHSALEEIREILLEHSCADSHTTKYITNKIDEVLND